MGLMSMDAYMACVRRKHKKMTETDAQEGISIGVALSHMKERIA